MAIEDKLETMPCPFGGNAKIIVNRVVQGRVNNSASLSSNNAGQRYASDGVLETSSVEQVFGVCTLAYSIPDLQHGSVDLDIAYREKQLKAAGCPKWRFRKYKFLFFAWKAPVECVFADGKKHPLA